eukprot:Cvel_26947.t1-p1 / transcript=Cvel_26947.t1 / gene=Cvel_26947 / organism=Chromera_velia_CCMP2878 / gene_product=hypothetical protein / transcript_product=hypothetical protein / location=Cvel_scaffold3283:1-1482(-) / protein_length=494 / sequence_SO=supercontig / SO=protein_coding / is_pseudo=false
MLRTHYAPPDGNCLFHSIAYFLRKNYADVRREICAHLERNRAAYQDFFGEEGFDQHLRDMRQDRCWGGEPEVRAAAQFYGVKIGVFKKLEENPSDENRPEFQFTKYPEANAYGEEAFLLWLHNQHYQPLVEASTREEAEFMRDGPNLRHVPKEPAPRPPPVPPTPHFSQSPAPAERQNDLFSRSPAAPAQPPTPLRPVDPAVPPPHAPPPTVGTLPAQGGVPGVEERRERERPVVLPDTAGLFYGDRARQRGSRREGVAVREALRKEGSASRTSVGTGATILFLIIFLAYVFDTAWPGYSLSRFFFSKGSGLVGALLSPTWGHLLALVCGTAVFFVRNQAAVSPSSVPYKPPKPFGIGSAIQSSVSWVWNLLLGRGGRGYGGSGGPSVWHDAKESSLPAREEKKPLFEVGALQKMRPVPWEETEDNQMRRDFRATPSAFRRGEAASLQGTPGTFRGVGAVGGGNVEGRLGMGGTIVGTPRTPAPGGGRGGAEPG